MARPTLTLGQAAVLEVARAHPLGWVTKNDIPGSLWGNVDQLERRGFLRGQGFGVWQITEIGGAALAKSA